MNRSRDPARLDEFFRGRYRRIVNRSVAIDEAIVECRTRITDDEFSIWYQHLRLIMGFLRENGGSWRDRRKRETSNVTLIERARTRKAQRVYENGYRVVERGGVRTRGEEGGESHDAPLRWQERERSASVCSARFQWHVGALCPHNRKIMLGFLHSAYRSCPRDSQQEKLKLMRELAGTETDSKSCRASRAR